MLNDVKEQTTLPSFLKEHQQQTSFSWALTALLKTVRRIFQKRGSFYRSISTNQKLAVWKRKLWIQSTPFEKHNPGTSKK